MTRAADPRRKSSRAPNAPAAFRNHAALFWTLAAIALVAGVLHAVSLAYVNDDAFISFRYARNWVRGLGLVFNAGERVEGYTNFLWTVIIAMGLRPGLDPVVFSETLGILFYALNLALFAWLAWRLRAPGERRVLLPLAAFALALHRDFNVYATSGLETSMFTFLISAAFALLVTARGSRAAFGAGLALTAAMMTRPDGVVFWGAAALYLFLTRDDWRRSGLLFAAPAVLVFLPYWGWRAHYYGHFFPNSFYAKSIGLPYYSQGLRYAMLYFKSYYVFAVLPVAGASLAWRGWRNRGMRRGSRGRGDETDAPPIAHPAPSPDAHPAAAPSAGRPSLVFRLRGEPRPALLASFFAVAFTLFIIRIGGDFMFARFFIPVTPMLFFLIERLVERTPGDRARAALAVLVLAATAAHVNLFAKENVVDEVADETHVYTKAHLVESRTKGETIHKYLAGLPVTAAFFGAQARLMYYADIPVAIESEAGLTDAFLAHMPVGERGRPGHEKKAPMAYLYQRGVNFIFGTFPDGLDKINFEKYGAEIVTYDPKVMEPLRRFPEVRFVPFTDFLDVYLTRIATLPRDRVERDYAFFKTYYFDHVNDPERERKIREAAGGG